MVEAISLWMSLALDVRPVRSNGFAGTIVVALVVMGLLSLIMVWISRKPKNRR